MRRVRIRNVLAHHVSHAAIPFPSRISVYESWPAAKGPQPVAKPLVKATGEAGSKEKEGGGAEEEEDEGEATPDGNKRLLADILSVSTRPVNAWGLGVCLTWLGLAWLDLGVYLPWA